VGWLILLLLLVFSLIAARQFGVRGAMLQAVAAALLFGSVGYALQGRPATPGSPARSDAGREVLPLTGARHAFFGNFSPVEHWLLLSEGMARAGNTELAVGVLQTAVRRNPTEAHLWVGLGNALVDHSRGLTPPAELAYRRAMELQPGYPAAPFFYGLALARSGDREGAVAEWRTLLATAPPDAGWRPLVEQGIAALSQPASR
jgi:cytochrome c-type biogenesis protein CcmH